MSYISCYISLSDEILIISNKGSIGVANARQSTIPLQVESENGSITNDIPTVLQKWKNDFSNLFNPNENEILDNEANILHTIGAAQPMMNDPEMNGMFTCDELKKVVKRAKCNKAPGFDEIPVDVLKNEATCLFLVKFFNICFSVGKIPKEWSKCVLNPIPKS